MMFRILSALALACALAAGAAAQDKPKQEGPKVSGGERDAAQKIEKAKGTEAKLQLAAGFVQKYPQSPLRAQIADALAREIAGTTDQQALGSLAQTFLEIFNKPEEAPLVTGSLLNSYINTGQTQDAMTLGAKWLAAHPDDISVMQNLTILASAQAIKGNNAFIAQGRDYGAKAIALLEADKMPAGGGRREVARVQEDGARHALPRDGRARAPLGQQGGGAPAVGEGRRAALARPGRLPHPHRLSTTARRSRLSCRSSSS